jgi:hypothetical protein
MPRTRVHREEATDSMTPVGMSVNSAAGRAGCSRTGLYEANRRGEIIFRKCGRRTIVLEEDLVAFLRSLPRKDSALSKSHRERALQRWNRAESQPKDSSLRTGAA